MGSLPTVFDEALDGLRVDVDLPLVVDDAAPPEAPVADARLERRRDPLARAGRPAARRGGRRRAAWACRARASTRRRRRGARPSARPRRGRRRARGARAARCSAFFATSAACFGSLETEGMRTHSTSSSTKRLRFASMYAMTSCMGPGRRPQCPHFARGSASASRSSDLERRRRRVRSPSVAMARSASAGLKPMPVSALAQALLASLPRRVGGRRARHRPAAAGRDRGSLSRSSSRSRSAIFLPTPGMPFSAARSCRATARASSAAGSAPRTATAIFGPDVRDAEERPERRALGLVREAEERQRVLAHVRVHPERDAPASSGRAPPERAERDRDLVAHARRRRGRRRRPPPAPRPCP